MMTPFTPLILLGLAGSAMAAEVRWQRLPLQGRQPQVATAADGSCHLVFLAGDARESDVWYRRRGKGEGMFSKPARVNDGAGSAIMTGTIRGAQIAVSGDGSVHVVWNGRDGDSLFCARMKSGGTGFEPARNVLGDTRHLDGGGAVAADSRGNVAVVWHGNAATGPEDERHRFVFAAISTNSAVTFSGPRRLNRDETGACGCCALSAEFTPGGRLRVVYRAAFTGMDRDIMQISGDIAAPPWAAIRLEAWKVGMCPMSTAALGTAADGTSWTAWEAADRVTFERAGSQPSALLKTPAGRSAKHPRLATNSRGETLCAWTEETGWARGGRVHWQLLDSAGKELSSGRHDDLPVWDFAAVIADPDGGFTILY